MSSGRSYRWRRGTLQIVTRWWTQWSKLYHWLHQSKRPPCWNESHMISSFHLPITWCSTILSRTSCTFGPLMKWVTKWPLNSLKVETVLRAGLLNHTLDGPLSIVGNALHMISSGTPYKCIRVLNDSRWLSRTRDPSYASTCGIWNLARRGKEVTCVVKGKSVRWTGSSRLVDNHPLMAFIIMSIFSFIIYMSYTMRHALLSNSDGRSVSSSPSRLLKTLLSSWSSLSYWSPVGRSLPLCSSLSRLLS